jgi:ATP-dependent DNA helicase RecQ
MMDELLVNLGLTREEALDGLRLLRAKRLLASRNDLSLKVIRNGNKTSRTVLDRTYTLQSLLLEHCKNAQVGKRFFLNLHDFNAKIQSVLGPSLFPRRDLAIFRGLLRYWKHRQVAEIELIEAGKQLYQIEFLSPPQEVRARTEGMWSGLQDSLNALLEIPDSPQGLIWFSLDDLVQKIHGDAGIKDPGAQHKTEMALLFLHSIGAIRLDRGLLVFYSAMVLHINQIQRNRRFSEDDFKKLEEHYENKAESIHIVGKYAELMQYAPRNAQEMVNDYFHMEIEDFRMKWMLGEKKTDAVSDELRMKIENSLNTEQQAVIRSRNKHILVAAGPGSGKTHLLVHKAASLLWMEKAKPESLLILTFTRAACVQLRKRLLDLAGDLAYSVRIATFHSFAFSILGMRGNLSESDKVVDHAATWLESDEAIEIGVPSVLMIDEYQDLSESEYHLLRAIYDLGEKTPRIIAVGDDDQSIYEFRGSSTRYFQKFTEDFPNAKVYNLTTNYRSLSGIVNTSATLLPLLKNRVKKEVSLHAYKTGKAELLFITAPYTTSYCCANWIARNISQWDTESVGVLSFHNIDLYRISAGLQEAHCTHQILRHSARDRFPLAQLREVIFFRKRLMNHPKVGSEPLTTEEFCAVLENSIQEFNTGNSWDIVRKMVNNYLSQEHEPTLYTWDSFVDEIKIQDLESTAITPITLCTMHASKGLEWDRVIICLDHWKPQSQQDWRTLYVACTRARKSLVIIGSMENLPPSWTKIFEQTLMREPARIPKQIEFELGMDDINLGHYLRKDDLCKKVQETLASTAGGNLFKVSPKYPTALTFGTLYMLWYSKKFQEKVLEPLEADGYKPLEAKLMHVCQWKESSSAEPYWIPLVKVKMRCDL